MSILNFDKKDFTLDGETLHSVHVRVQQRNTRKALTTIQGLLLEPDEFKNLLTKMKKKFCCNGTVVQDREHGSILQLQGNHRDAVAQFLVEHGVCSSDQMKLHGA